jgi:hypothetical protein
MTLDKFLDLAGSFPDELSTELLVNVSTFLIYAPRFKKEILFAQESNWPAEVAPWILPESVIILLSNLCDIREGTTKRMWLYLKDAVWKHHEREREVDMRFKLYGKSLGYGKPSRT